MPDPTARRRVLVLIDYFLPGENAGGPVRTIAALTRRLGHLLDFLIVTRDHDLGEPTRYAVPTRRWVAHAGARCRYLGRAERTPWGIARVLRTTPHDVLYLNGIFSLPFTLTPLVLRRLRLVPRHRVIVAPRGQLDTEALALKAGKKRIYLAVVQGSRLLADVTWQATNAGEVAAIRRRFGAEADVHVAPNLRVAAASAPGPRAGPPSPLQVVFLSRISPMKNLIGAIDILSGVEAAIDFDIYGTLEDAGHWRRVERALDRLPGNVRARYRGAVPGSEVDATLRRYDVLLLPTLGENYGHVIAESLAAGCAPLISDRTPWRDLAADGAGWDLPLEDPASFRDVLEQVAREAPAERAARRRAAVARIAAVDADPSGLAANARLFGLADLPAARPRAEAR